MAHLNPYLIFAGQSRAAMELYHSVLGGDLSIATFGDMGEVPPGVDAGGVMHAYLHTADGFRLMASDGPPGETVTHGNDFAVSLHGEADDEQRLRSWWDGFAAAGTIDVPLERQMWGDLFGQVTDPFGIAWMFNIATADPA